MGVIVTGRTDNLYISGFDTILSIAAYFAQITDCNAIAIGVTKEQTQQLPRLQDALKLYEQHVELMNPDAGKFSVLTPLASLTKSEIVALGHQLNVPVAMTWSCLHGGREHCGKCPQCLHRKSAFKDAGVEDPTSYSEA